MTVDQIVGEINGNMSNTGGADYIQLTTQMGIVESVVGVILGLMMTIIFIGIPLVVAVEVSYLNFPVMQESLDKLQARINGKSNTALGLVLRDARLAYRMANTVETGQSVNLIYLKLKCKSILLAVLLAGLVLGAGPSVIQLIITIAKAFISGFNEVI